MEHRDVLIAGGGASGLMAAIFAAEGGARVRILERDKRIGAKLLRTGNGRCNLSRRSIHPGLYEKRGRAFAAITLQEFSPGETLDTFRRIGLLTREIDGLIYPYNEEASAVLSALRERAGELGVKIRQNEPVLSVTKENSGFTVGTAGWKYFADRVILACGSRAGLPAETPESLSLAGNLGHHILPETPALAGLTVSPGTEMLDGVRVRAAVRLLIDGTEAAAESGRVQFTGKGISGICVMNLCAAALEAHRFGRRAELSLDLAADPAVGADEIDSCAGSLVPGKLLRYLRGRSGSLKETVRDLRFVITGSFGLPRAQAACGGVDTEEVNPFTMESRIVPGLYFCGEMLDVTGSCGGCNLQFAWSSGAVAGMHAAL